MRQIAIVAALLSIVTITSCQREEVIPVQQENLSINIILPTNGDIYKKGDDIPLKADIRYISQMHGYIIKITDKNSGALLYETEGHTHDDKISINQSWPNSVANSTDLEVRFIAVIDHDDNEKSKSVTISTRP